MYISDGCSMKSLPQNETQNSVYKLEVQKISVKKMGTTDILRRGSVNRNDLLKLVFTYDVLESILSNPILRP